MLIRMAAAAQCYIDTSCRRLKGMKKGEEKKFYFSPSIDLGYKYYIMVYYRIDWFISFTLSLFLSLIGGRTYGYRSTSNGIFN